MALTDKLSAIGDAIREKTGGTDKLTLDEMVTEIGSIEGGEVIEVESHEWEDWLLSRESYAAMEKYENDRITQLYSSGGNVWGYVLSFPNVTKVIEGYMMSNNYVIKKLNMPKLEQINNYLINGCGSIKYLYFPQLKNGYQGMVAQQIFTLLNVVSIDAPLLLTSGANFIQNCSKLVNINFPNYEGESTDSTAYIANRFSASSALQYVKFPKLTTLHNGDFKSCSELKVVDLDAVTSIKKATRTNAAFYNCNKLQAVILRSPTMVPMPHDATYTFPNTSTLATPSVRTYIYVPSALLEEYKTATNWSVIADFIRAIEDWPDVCDVPIGCYYDEEATTVDLANSSDMNSGYKTLTGINAPNATKVNARAASNLIYVNCPKVTTLYGSDFLLCSKLEILDLPSLDCVYSGAFMDCTALKKVEFTADKKAVIFENAFRGCSALKTVILRHEGAVSNINAHEGVNADLTYYVPSSLLAEYEAKNPDYKFAAIEDHPEIEYAECV